MIKKYELVQDERITFTTIDGAELYRVKALIDFKDVKAGDLGGWVRSEDNLSHEGDCWIYDNAMVDERAIVRDNAEVRGECVVHDKAVIGGNAVLDGNITVADEVKILQDSYIQSESRICFGGCSVIIGTIIQECDC